MSDTSAMSETQSSAPPASSSTVPAPTDSTAVSQQASSTSKLDSTDATPASVSTSVPAQPTSSDEQLDAASALAVLMSLETRPSPASHAAQQRRHWFNSMYCCCFDLAGWPDGCSWKAERMCRRCTALYALCQVHSKVGTGDKGCGIAQAILSSVANATDCSSRTACQGTMPRLPPELIDLIFDQVMLDAHTGHFDARAVQVLMHTCVRTRARLLRDVEPLIMRQSPTKLSRWQSEANGTWMEPFCALVAWHIQSSLQSFTSNPASTTTNAPPSIPESQELVAISRTPEPRVAHITIVLRGGAVGLKVCYVEIMRPSTHQPLRVCDITAAFHKLLDEEFTPVLPRYTEPYLRARSGYFNAAESRCRVEFSIALGSHVLVREWDICAAEWEPNADDKPLLM